MKDDEESVGGAGSAQIIPTTPRPFALLRVTWMQSFLGQSRYEGKGALLTRKKKDCIISVYVHIRL